MLYALNCKFTDFFVEIEMGGMYNCGFDFDRVMLCNRRNEMPEAKV